MGPKLMIYTMTHCLTCAETSQTVAQIRQRMPDLEIQIVDLERPDTEIPSKVFSAPTYMVNGDVISLGNPYGDQLEASIRRYIPAT
ncbi:MAG: thioredoxin family protein [Thermomicrobiales bacterium]